MDRRKKVTLAAVDRARVLAGGSVALGELLGVSSQMVSQWLAGARPVNPYAAVTIELALGVRADQLSELVPWRALPELQRARARRQRVHRGRSRRGRANGQHAP